MINISHDPKKYNKKLTQKMMRHVAVEEEKLALEYSEKDPAVVKSSRQTLMYYNQERSSNFFVQFWWLLHRFILSTFRTPLFKFVFIISLYSAYLYGVAFNGFGRIDLESDMKGNAKIFQVWLSLVFILSRNSMFQINGAEAMQISERAPVFNREKSSGMYSAHSFYLATIVH